VPIGVGAAVAYTVGHGGLGVLYNLAWLIGTVYLALVFGRVVVSKRAS
jgi:proton glutamate symport protein